MLIGAPRGLARLILSSEQGIGPLTTFSPKDLCVVVFPLVSWSHNFVVGTNTVVSPADTAQGLLFVGLRRNDHVATRRHRSHRVAA